MNKPESETLEEYQTRADETDDGFHNGQLRVLQPRKGYRAGLDAVMIAAAVPALPGERIVEAGSGTGVASLCLMNRVAGLTLFGLEVNRQYADLSRRNADRNKLSGGFHVVEGDIAMPPRQYGEYGLEPGSFAHAFANPPYRDEAGARAGADEGRNRANLLSSGELLSWV
ncbi:MAG: methyltransferase, partial [Fimbriimonadaceae bacterium]|nr:methyltransferase [Alphaproteobacteria bacterium]